MATNDDRPEVQVLERGRVYFLYRPATGTDSPHGVVDLRRFYLVLHPDGSETRRLLVIGRKKLPDAQDVHQRFWGFVDRVAESPEAFAQALGTGQTAARPAGEGVYAIERHAGHTHLSYTLGLPEQPGEVQQALNIRQEGHFMLIVKNPRAGSPSGMGLDGDRRASFPDELQARFGDRRFIAPDSAAWLDVESAELLLMGMDEDANAFTIDIDADDIDAHVFEDLAIARTDEANDPLMKGHWS